MSRSLIWRTKTVAVPLASTLTTGELSKPPHAGAVEHAILDKSGVRHFQALQSADAFGAVWCLW